MTPTEPDPEVGDGPQGEPTAEEEAASRNPEEETEPGGHSEEAE